MGSASINAMPALIWLLAIWDYFLNFQTAMAEEITIVETVNLSILI